MDDDDDSAAPLNSFTFQDAHPSALLERLRYARDNGRFCDVSISVGDRRFSAHRAVLAAASPYFDSILRHDRVAREHLVVNSSNSDVFDNLLNYMYSGQIVIDRLNVRPLLKLSNNLLMTRLKMHCAEYLERSLDAPNCIALKELAAIYNLPSLAKAASDFFATNVNRCVLESSEVLHMDETAIHRLLHDTQHPLSADTQLKLVVRWASDESSSSSRAHRLGPLLSGCRVALASPDTHQILLDFAPILADGACRLVYLHILNSVNSLPSMYAAQLEQLEAQFGPVTEADLRADAHASSAEPDDEDDLMNADGAGDDLLDGPAGMKLRLKNNRLHRKVFDPATGTVKLVSKRGRPVRVTTTLPAAAADEPTEEPEHEDDIDGVYPEIALEDAVTYEQEDPMDPMSLSAEEEQQPEPDGAHDCAYCQFAHSQAAVVERHRVRAHSKPVLHVCPFCQDFRAVWNQQLYRHVQQSHTPSGPPFACDRCDYSDERLPALLAHRLAHFDTLKAFVCATCGHEARTKTRLLAHFRSHAESAQFVHCGECGRRFSTKTALDAHLQTHGLARPYSCDVCGFTTRFATHLAAHRRCHTGDVLYCHIAGCTYWSAKKSQLAAHMRTHLAVRAFVCTLCQRGFVEKSHLVRHERIHLRDKPFKCSNCDYASSRRDKLKEHILKYHTGGSGSTTAATAGAGGAAAAGTGAATAVDAANNSTGGGGGGQQVSARKRQRRSRQSTAGLPFHDPARFEPFERSLQAAAVAVAPEGQNHVVDPRQQSRGASSAWSEFGLQPDHGGGTAAASNSATAAAAAAADLRPLSLPPPPGQ